ncbi:right-handed parallel beta-helix repeat-containing protein [Streptacidiphilus jiangxiensis]|uniref:Right handed beta helix region n=1 Tax=Streptacidiphilus jiangxiensis TaxID=235985 RepID=A0A1H7G2L3_STRJI|nr:right-handed parallel beta-helix repeat-containing protein [Streptacidiphilus jiangxiensis]SEK30700.1 Right handed beta helix region [Streptacidiphilus jiangxiensis]
MARRGRRLLFTLIGVAGLAMGGLVPVGASAASAHDRDDARALLVCNGSTTPCPRTGDRTHVYRTVQAAVDAAHRGDWVLIWPGVYHEKATADAGVLITTPGIHLRGLDRNRVVVDGSNGTAAHPCPSEPALQDRTGRSGIVVSKADDVSIENLTVCNYLSADGYGGGNEIWWNGGDGSGAIGLHRYHGAYLTATSGYGSADASAPMAQYGIFASNATGPAVIAHTYASNMGDSDYYVGACRDICGVTLTDAHGQNSALGFSGTNSGGYTIRNSEFDHNRTGIAPNSLNNDDAPPPQDGSCVNAPQSSCTFIEHNFIHDNNNPNAPVSGLAPVIGVGVEISGGHSDTVRDNRIERQGSWGVVVHDFPDSETPPSTSHCQGGVQQPGVCVFLAYGNVVTGNAFSHVGFFGNPTNADVANESQTAPHNCFTGNRVIGGGVLTSDPARIQNTAVDGTPCGAGAGVGDSGLLFGELVCAAGFGQCPVPGATYPQRTGLDLAPILPQATMPHPCAGLPENRFCR